MYSGTDAIDQSERIPQWAAEVEARGVPESPGEAYLLSRIDGCTPWSTLCEIGGMPREQADKLLEGWLAAGFLTLAPICDEMGPGGGLRAGAPSSEPAEAQVDPSLDLSTELQRRILDFDAKLESLDYFELLGVERSADARSVKQAYFALSREFHPDRYYRRKVGRFAARLDRIFAKVVEAYELLHDPTTRAEVECNLRLSGQECEKPTPASGGEGERSPGKLASKARMQHLSRLRESFRLPGNVSSERCWKARRFFQAAEMALELENFREAAANARLAIAFDPSEETYRVGFAAIQSDVHRLRARALLDRASGVGDQAQALELLEEAIHYRPGDVELSARASRLAMALGDLPRAMTHAQSAAEIEPGRISHQLLCARVLRRCGDFESARACVQRASDLDADAPEVAAERQRVERGARG
ncbi:MAG: DnaJ domain-containing protein [Myxococcota bacterium]